MNNRGNDFMNYRESDGGRSPVGISSRSGSAASKVLIRLTCGRLVFVVDATVAGREEMVLVAAVTATGSGGVVGVVTDSRARFVADGRAGDDDAVTKVFVGIVRGSIKSAACRSHLDAAMEFFSVPRPERRQPARESCAGT